MSHLREAIIQRIEDAKAKRGISWERLCDEAGVTSRQVRRLRNQASFGFHVADRLGEVLHIDWYRSL